MIQFRLRRVYLIWIKNTSPYQLVDFAVPVDHRGKIKENEGFEEFQEFTRDEEIMGYQSDSSNNHRWDQKTWERDWVIWKSEEELRLYSQYLN